MKLLIVAADRMEFPGIAARVNNCRAAGIAAADWSRTGTLGAHEVLLLANGAGARRAAAAVAAGLAAFRADSVVSTGFCGALDPSLEIADVVLGTCVAGQGRLYPAGAAAGGRSAKQGRIESIDHVAQTAEEKRRLNERNSIAVEMEAAGVAAAAERAGLPFFCIRSVTDLASEDMANNFNAALRADGHFGTMKILVGMLRHPSARLPELIRLRKRCARAAQALGEFFADSRF